MPAFLQTTHDVLEHLMPVMSNAELRVSLTVLRLTQGQGREQTEQLPIPNLAALSGLSESSCKTGIQEGLTRGSLRRFEARDQQNRLVYTYAFELDASVNRLVIDRSGA